MKKFFLIYAISASVILLTGCGSKESAKSIAQKWCNLNGKVDKATNDTEKEAAKLARDKFEDQIEAKYEKDKAFMDEVKKEAEKCEDASEGK